jgi:hypothetical protein
VPGPADLRGTVSHGRGNACVSCSRPEAQSLSPDRDEFPGRQAVGLQFWHPAEALRQSDCENAPQERFQSVLWARSFQPGRALSRRIFAHRLRLAQGRADTCTTQDCDAVFPPVITMLQTADRGRAFPPHASRCNCCPRRRTSRIRSRNGPLARAKGCLIFGGGTDGRKSHRECKPARADHIAHAFDRPGTSCPPQGGPFPLGQRR